MSFSVRYADLAPYFQAQFHRDPLVSCSFACPLLSASFFHYYYLAELRSLSITALFSLAWTGNTSLVCLPLFPVASAVLMSVQVPSCPHSCNLQHDLNSRCCVHLAYRLGHFNLKVIVVSNCRQKESWFVLIFLSSEGGQLPKFSKPIRHMLEASSCDEWAQVFIPRGTTDED